MTNTDKKKGLPKKQSQNKDDGLLEKAKLTGAADAAQARFVVARFSSAHRTVVISADASGRQFIHIEKHGDGEDE